MNHTIPKSGTGEETCPPHPSGLFRRRIGQKAAFFKRPAVLLPGRSIGMEARRRRPIMAILLLAAAVFYTAGAAGADVKRTVTAYSYNSDGALTAVSTASDGKSPTTKYMTWDNFRPDAVSPAGGAVSAGDGRMTGFGPGPGTDDLTARFDFDARDRLLGYNGEAGEETYDYHAGGMLLSSSMGDDARYFFHDAGANPVVTNIYHSGSDLWSAFLANARFVNDGSAQVLLKPRKDVAANYDPDSRTMDSYAFDAFGSRTDGNAPSGIYDPHDNPFGYAGEYRDPVWGGIYLRARWYHPGLPVFLSRDPKPHLNRFAYAGGNPVMKVDPSGYSASFWKKAEGFLRRADKALNRGVGGHFARIFLAPLLGPLQIAAYPGQFWEAVRTNKSGTDLFLAFGVVSEAVGGYIDAAVAGYGVRLARRFAFRTVSDFAIGTSAAITAASRRGFNHFSWNTFAQGMEYTASPIVLRGFTGSNVRTGFRFTADNVAELAEQLRNADQNTALIFRMRVPATDLSNLTWSSPFQEAAHMGFYHDSLLAITKDGLLGNSVAEDGVSFYTYRSLNFDNILAEIKQAKGKFQLVAKIKDMDVKDFYFFSNPYNRPIVHNTSNFSDWHIHTYDKYMATETRYNTFTNNCHHHCTAVLKAMGLR